MKRIEPGAHSSRPGAHQENERRYWRQDRQRSLKRRSSRLIKVVMPIRKAMTPTPWPAITRSCKLPDPKNKRRFRLKRRCSMALRYQADTQTKPLAPTQIRLCQGNTAFKDGQLAEVIRSLQVGLPLAKATMVSTNSSSSCGITAVEQRPASKSIQCFSFAASSLLVAIFTAGAAAGRRAATGAEQHHMQAGAGQRAGGDRVVARRAQYPDHEPSGAPP